VILFEWKNIGELEVDKEHTTESIMKTPELLFDVSFE